MPPGVHTIIGATTSLDYDAQLMLRVKEGDGASFALLLSKHRTVVVHFLYRMVQDFAIAEELAQEVFLRVYRSRNTYQPTAKFTTWLFRIATHLAFNWLRDGKSERGQERLDNAPENSESIQVSDHTPSAEQHLLTEAKFQEIRNAIESLPLKQRSAVLMHKYEEMEYSEIAGVLSCSESAVKSLLFRAYQTLRTRLAHLA